MNYIKLLNAAFEKFFFDDRLNPSHISLYMALFQEWNSHRFAAEFYVNRRELMRVAKIGSKSTYHRCVTDLDSWNYLTYFPSSNPYKGSKIKMLIFGSNDEPVMGQYDPILEQVAEHYRPKNEPLEDQHRPVSGQVLVPYINNNKQENINKQPKDRQAVLIFFKEKGFSADEGKKFFAHYETSDWKTSDGKGIKNWQALAISWMDRTRPSEEKKQTQGPPRNDTSNGRDHLRTPKTKDYGQPL
ncbi:hypothetical protein ACH3O9_14015 [Leeuwenhoekiella sp. A16]|uniref:hypothetical protein n=1 Tax=unclassified Leeuwenhoekiella TaxID=2615029 RepID=UPI003A80D1F3